MQLIKMIKTVKGSSDGRNVATYKAREVYPTDSIPLSESLKDAFLAMDVAIIHEPLMPEQNQSIPEASKKKEKNKKKVREMNKGELEEYITAAGLVVDDMLKAELLEIAIDLEADGENVDS